MTGNDRIKEVPSSGIRVTVFGVVGGDIMCAFVRTHQAQPRILAKVALGAKSSRPNFSQHFSPLSCSGFGIAPMPCNTVLGHTLYLVVHDMDTADARQNEVLHDLNGQPPLVRYAEEDRLGLGSFRAHLLVRLSWGFSAGGCKRSISFTFIQAKHTINCMSKASQIARRCKDC